MELCIFFRSTPMSLREVGQTSIPDAERGGAMPHAQHSVEGRPMPPQADVEYANSLGVEYFSLVADCGQGVSRPRAPAGKASAG